MPLIGTQELFIGNVLEVVKSKTSGVLPIFLGNYAENALWDLLSDPGEIPEQGIS